MKTIDFPVHPKLNPDGQFNKLAQDGQKRWFLLNTTTNQSKQLVGNQVIVALAQIVVPLLA